MSHIALYRKFRPQTFEDVKGQDHIVTTLKNQIRSNRVGHAYLFCGTRGTGKTTIAKILARAVNCENPQDGNPCEECATCKAILAGRSLNVAEIDAAANNSVENIRNIIDEISYPPVEGKYKVYIMDEAHMLSEGARNALLKTLEEPPSYVIFILATTESPRIPITVMSRCQRYDFKRIPITTIAERMKELTDAEGFDVEERAIRYIAKAADGSMRDGLSLLDRCIVDPKEKVTYEKVLEILGAVDTSVFSRLFRLIRADDVIGSMELVEEVVMQGRELVQFVNDFIWYLRSIMLLISSDEGDMEELLNISAEHLAALREDAAQTELDAVMRYITVFSELSAQMRYATQKRIFLEMYLIRLMRPQMESDTSALLERTRRMERQLDKLEEQMANGVPVRVQPGEAGKASAGGTEEPDKVELTHAVPEDLKKIVREWEIIKGKADEMLRAYLDEAKLSMGENERLLICFSDRYSFAIRDEEVISAIGKLLAEHSGKQVDFDLKTFREDRAFESQYADLGELFPGVTIETDTGEGS